MRARRTTNRDGAVLALVVLCLLPMLALTALAVDMGLLALARTQCQNAADAAAMAGARTLNGNAAASNNSGSVGTNAGKAIQANGVLGTTLNTGVLSTQVGRYVYNSTAQRFEGQFPGPSSENFSMVRATVSVNVQSSMAFSKVLNFTAPNIQTVATAAHRPRDVAVILDYSGSMRFASLMGKPAYTNPRSSNNPDSRFPTFGHYSSGSANLQASGFNEPYAEPNVSTTSSDGRAPIIEDFYTDSSGTPAFSAASSAFGATPAGDNYLKNNFNGSSTWASTVAGILNISSGSVTNSTRNSSWETNGYGGVTGTTFSGYTQGPGYWGKTFWIWPPDPSNAPPGDPLNNSQGGGPTRDWRRRYFFNGGTSTPLTDNSRLYNSSGHWQTPGSSTYSINYNAILHWIKNIGPNPFPSRLQAGRILYYDAIPDSIDASTFQPGNLNQRFWKDYIDYVLGVLHVNNSTWDISVNGSAGDTGYGPDYSWGTIRITSESSLSGNPRPYMHYLDNPRRPRLHFWFGPLSMIDFLGCYNNWNQVSPYGSRFAWWPGTCHESPMYACKLGVRAALNDINNNHPNDLVSLIMFSVPMTSANDPNGRRFNRVRVGLSRDYPRMQESLWYPPDTLMNPGATVRPYHPNNLEVPRALGGTCYSMPLMLAYNQFSSNATLRSYNPAEPSGDAGGNGRRGAQKIVIFETDGAPNWTASASLVSGGGPAQNYYRVRFNSSNPGGSEFPSGVSGYSDNASTVTNQIFDICQQIAAQESAGGFSTPTKPVQIHCIGFGPLVSPDSSSRGTIITTLSQMQSLGNVDDGMPEYKLVYGTEGQVVGKLQQAFTQILQSGVQVSLIE